MAALGTDLPIIFRLYRPGDEQSILSLFERCFQKRMDLDHWQWKYADNPYGQYHILVAVQAGRIIAHYGAYPVPIRDGRNAVGTALQIGDVMTDPRVRGTGFGKRSVIARLAQAFYATCCQGRVLFNFGVPSAKHLRLGKLVLDYHSIGPVQEWRLDADSPAHLNSFSRADQLRGRRYRVVRNSPDLAAVEALYRSVQPTLGIAVGREARYLKWRYLERPRADYHFYQITRGDQLVLWAVSQPRVQELALGDVIITPAAGAFPFQLLLQALNRDFGGRPMVLWSPSRPAWWQEQLLAAGFRVRPQPLALGTAFTFFDRSRYDILRMNRNWFYAMADFDLF